MRIRTFAGMALLAAAAFAGGCANDGDFLGGSLTTASIEPAAKAQPVVDPQCVALMSKIDTLRKEGTPERIEKVAAGKSKTAVVKRDALQRITELDKANAEFQSRCSTLTSSQRAAAAAPPGPAAASTEPAKQAAVDASKQNTVKTVAKTAPKSPAKTAQAVAATASGAQ
jgi:hypothetical protein